MLLPVTARMAARTELTLGLAKTPPSTAAVSIPFPMKPACAGSCPQPPPEISATWLSLTAAKSERTTTCSPSRRLRLGCATRRPCIDSSTQSSGLFSSFLAAGPMSDVGALCGMCG